VNSAPQGGVEVLTALLNHFGWAQRSFNPGLYAIWSQALDSDDEILVPLDPLKGDFEALVTRATQTILTRYGQRAYQVNEMLRMRQQADLEPICWKKDTAESFGIIDWEAGATLFDSARTQLMSAARSTRQRQSYHGNSGSFIAKQFLENTLMGQTDYGSFVITAYVPRNKDLFLSKAERDRAAREPAAMLPRGRVSSSEVIETFDRALRSLRGGLDQYQAKPQVEMFGDTVADGVSYELVRSIADMVSTGETEIGIGHTHIETPKDTEKAIVFAPVEVSVLRRVENLLARTAEPRKAVISGQVTLLSKEDDEPEVRLIRINVESGAEARKVKVRLTEAQHELALDAYHNGISLSVEGRLEREGNTYWLYGAENVRQVDPSSGGNARAVIGTKSEQGEFQDPS
jgi:hypothetical protein